MSTSAPVQSPFSLSPAITPGLRDRWSVDGLKALAFTHSAHPGLIDSRTLPGRIESYLTRHPDADKIRRGRLSQKGSYCLTRTMDHVSYTQLTGPGSYVLLVRFSATRRVRYVLEQSKDLAAYDPGVSDQFGNVISPGHLGDDIGLGDVPRMTRAEAAQTLLELPSIYRRSLKGIFGIDESRNIQVSFNGIEIAWDLPSPEPLRLVRSFARPGRLNLLDRPRPQSQGPGQIAPVYAVVGDSPRFRFIAYEKLAARDGQVGVARFEFRFRKAKIKKVLGSLVLPQTAQGIHEALGALAAHAWPYLLAFEADRQAPSVTVSWETVYDKLGGLRNRAHAIEVLRSLTRDGKVRVTNQNRRLLKKLETLGWVRKLLFRRPAHRKLSSEIKLDLWSRRGHGAFSFPPGPIAPGGPA